MSEQLPMLNIALKIRTNVQHCLSRPNQSTALQIADVSTSCPAFNNILLWAVVVLRKTACCA
jgi:hypothetical protein